MRLNGINLQSTPSIVSTNYAPSLQREPFKSLTVSGHYALDCDTLSTMYFKRRNFNRGIRKILVFSIMTIKLTLIIDDLFYPDNVSLPTL